MKWLELPANPSDENFKAQNTDNQKEISNSNIEKMRRKKSIVDEKILEELIEKVKKLRKRAKEV